MPDSDYLLDMPYVSGGQGCQDFFHPSSLENVMTSPEYLKHSLSAGQEDQQLILVRI